MKKKQREAARLAEILDILRASGDLPRPGLHYRSPWELLVATVLSAQCTDARVNTTTPALFARFPDPASLARAETAEVEQIIHSIGLYRNKARNLVALAARLTSRHGGEVPPEREALEALPGVGRKTASVVLSQAFDIPAFAVDTHVGRVCARLGFAPSPDPRAVEDAVTALLPPERWRDAHLLLIRHGRTICNARRPACGRCPVNRLCPWPERRRHVRPHPAFEEAYLLRSVPFRDNDAVVTLLTPSGRISALARGARSSRRRFGAALDFFCLLRAELRPRRAGMGELLSVELVRSFEHIRGDIGRYLVGSHFLEVARLSSREGDPAANPFRLLDAALGALDGGADPRSLLRVFQIRAVAEAGFALDGSSCAFCGEPLAEGGPVSFRDSAPACPACAGASGRTTGPGARKTLRAARLLPFDRLATLRISSALEREIGPLAEEALVRALGEEPRSLASLRGAFSDAAPGAIPD